MGEMNSMSGFYNAPVSKALCLVSMGLTTFAVLSGDHGSAVRNLHLDPTLYYGNNMLKLLARMVASPFMYNTLPELMVGSIVVYSLRFMERQVGSSKFAALVAATSLCAAALQLAVLVLMHSHYYYLPGPHGFLLALLYIFFVETPVTITFMLLPLGFNLSDKTFLYLMGAQLLFSHPTSIICGACGLAAGAACNTDY